MCACARRADASNTGATIPRMVRKSCRQRYAGSYVHLSTNDRRNPVLKTSQIPHLVDALHLVGGRIDRMWEKDGETFTGGLNLNDPAVIREGRIDQLTLLDNLRAHFSEVAGILMRSEDMHDASRAIAPLLRRPRRD